VAHSPAEPLVDEHPGEVSVSSFVYRAAAPSGDALVLTHGASGICNTPLLVALAEAFAASGRATPPSNIRPIAATGSKLCCES
jgi:hypothetical protein